MPAIKFFCLREGVEKRADTTVRTRVHAATTQNTLGESTDECVPFAQLTSAQVANPPRVPFAQHVTNRASGPGNRSYECLTADGEWQPTPEVPVELRAADLVAAPKEPTSEHTEWLVLDPLLKYLVLSRQCCTAWLS